MDKIIIKLKHESDGPCFGLVKDGTKKTCEVLNMKDKNCGNYYCSFYKPVGCKDWIRRDRGMSVELIPPEMYEKERRRNG